jgi:hypothetical protein
MSQVVGGFLSRGVGMKAMRKLGSESSFSEFRLVFLLIIAVCLLMSGCKAAPTWSTESRSPDGRMVAKAEVFTNGGFAAPGPSTTFVYLKQTTGSEKAVLIFAFSQGPPEGMQVKMDWLNPAHLELTYEGQHTIDFQAVRYAGVDISVRNAVLGSATSK